MPRIRVLYIISGVDKAPVFEWIAEQFSSSKSLELSFCFLGPVDPSSSRSIRKNFGASSSIILKCKLQGLKAWYQLFCHIRRYNPHVVHCHLLTASILGLLASCVAGVPVRIFTRHHGSMHHRGIRKGLLWDLLCNALATKIVSISPVTSRILCNWEHVNPSKVVFIPHGFQLSSFRAIDNKRVLRFKKKYGLPVRSVIIGVVSRFVDWKGVQYIVDAFLSIYKDRPDLHLLLMNASGPCMSDIQSRLQGLPESAWTQIAFEYDMPAAYHAMDLCVHTPVDSLVEAFGQVYIESLASGVPMICTLSGIANLFIRDESNALVVPYKDSRAIAQAIMKLLSAPALREQLAINGFIDIKSRFSLDSMCAQLERLYLLEAPVK